MFDHGLAAKFGFEINIYSFVERSCSFSYIINVAPFPVEKINETLRIT